MNTKPNSLRIAGALALTLLVTACHDCKPISAPPPPPAKVKIPAFLTADPRPVTILQSDKTTTTR